MGTKEQLKIRYHDHLNKAMIVLKEKPVNPQFKSLRSGARILEHLATKGIIIGDSGFTNYRKNYPAASISTYKQILQILDEYIDEGYELRWNDRASEYLSEHGLETAHEYLFELNGVWDFYCWATKSTTGGKEATVPGYINMCVMEITNGRTVNFKSRSNIFQGEVYKIANDKFYIEINNEKRQSFFIGNLGTTIDADKPNLPGFTVGYVDSSIGDVVTGLGVFIRNVKDAYEAVTPKYCSIGELHQSYPALVEFLRDTEQFSPLIDKDIFIKKKL